MEKRLENDMEALVIWGTIGLLFWACGLWLRVPGLGDCEHDCCGLDSYYCRSIASFLVSAGLREFLEGSPENPKPHRLQKGLESHV